jgi:hypothetical protein
MSNDKDYRKGPVGHDNKPVRTPLANATNSDPDKRSYTGMAAMPFNFHMSYCSRPFCPKLEIQHNRRGRGMPTLTEGKYGVVVVPKKKIMTLRFYESDL